MSTVIITPIVIKDTSSSNPGVVSQNAGPITVQHTVQVV
jgi:hypothetical protein